MNSPRRRTLRKVLKPRQSKDTFWNDLCNRIKDGKVIPIISSNVADDYLLSPLIKRLQPSDPNEPIAENLPTTPYDLNVREELADLWAEHLGYPLSDNITLAQVAQYNRVKSNDDEHAKRDYLTFLKEILIDIVEKADAGRADIIREQRRMINESSFSDMVWALGLSDESPDDDPLRLLARLNLPIYLTTSYDNLLERAIRVEGRANVCTQICGSIGNLRPEHHLNDDFQPSPEHPVVYHLHGLEDYPASLVLSEDDYLDFLVRITKPVDPGKPEIPLYLREKLTDSTLLLLGYRLQDWDFRTTFFGLIGTKEVMRQPLPYRPFSIAIQLSPRNQTNATNPEEAERYLTDYFKLANFHVVWNDSIQFMRILWKEWNCWRQGDVE
jgi:hypothetical protein